MSATAAPAAASAADALHAHAEALVAAVLRENAGRWETLSPADRDRVGRLAHRIAQRLLHDPAQVLGTAERHGDEHRIRLAQDLFGLTA